MLYIAAGGCTAIEEEYESVRSVVTSASFSYGWSDVVCGSAMKGSCCALQLLAEITAAIQSAAFVAILRHGLEMPPEAQGLLRDLFHHSAE